MNAEMSDEEREARIVEVCQELMVAPSREDAYGCWVELVRLVKSRSPSQVERMEREMGLR
jgi:hypothetical protein